MERGGPVDRIVRPVADVNGGAPGARDERVVAHPVLGEVPVHGREVSLRLEGAEVGVSADPPLHHTSDPRADVLKL
jgi:hypothetical protein